MTYIVNIVANDRTWYDSRIISSDAVVFENVNYITGDDRSVNVVRQRFLQDWARRAIPNSIREGIGLTLTPSTDDIVVTEGYAFVAGRFLNIPAGTFTAGIGGETLTTGTYYLAIRVDDGIGLHYDPSNISEGDTRNPKNEVAHLIARSLPYTKNHNELVIGKFVFDSSVITSFEDYTAIQEWQASVISPVSVIPELSTGSNSILMRAYSGTTPEVINNLGIEEDKTRFYLNAVFNDQVGSTEIKVINKSNVLLTRNLADDAYYGHDILDLSIENSKIISALGVTVVDKVDLTNIGTINTGIIGGNTLSVDIIDRDSVQTMTNKTLTSPEISGGNILIATLIAPRILDSAANNTYSILTSDLPSNTTITLPRLLNNDTFVFENHIQSLNNKTMTSETVISSFWQDSIGGSYEITVPSINDTLVTKNTTDLLSNKILATLEFNESGTPTYTYSIVGQTGLSANRILTIPTNITDTFMFVDYDHTDITGIKRFQSDNLFQMDANTWSSATHLHNSDTTGGILSAANLTGILSTSNGGTGLATISATNGILYGKNTSNIGVLTTSTKAQTIISQTDGVPHWDSPTLFVNYGGDLYGSSQTATMDELGNTTIELVASVYNDSHTHSIANLGMETIVYAAADLKLETDGGSVTKYKTYAALNFNYGDDARIFFPHHMSNKKIDKILLRARASTAFDLVPKLQSYYDNDLVYTQQTLAEHTFGTAWTDNILEFDFSVVGERDILCLTFENNDNNRTLYIGAIHIIYS